MKQIVALCVFLAGILSGSAQTVIDHFTVGPYIVDYVGQGEIKYRLRDNIDLYEFFELQKDTTIVNAAVPEIPVEHAIQLSVSVGSNPYRAKEFGFSGLWKQKIGANLYFNGGLSLAICYSDFGRVLKRSMFEVGVPLQIEVGKLNHQKGSLFGTFGIAPVLYSSISAKKWDGKQMVDDDTDLKKSGIMIEPCLEFGGNVPVGGAIVRIGVYGKYKINCTTDAIDIYQQSSGRFILGPRISVVF